MNVSVKANMTQRIDLAPYYSLIEARRAKATIRCLVGYDVHITVTQLNRNHHAIAPTELTAFRWSELLKPATTSLQLTIQFSNPINNNFSWHHYVELDIEADVRAPDTHLLHPWQIF